MNGAMKLALPVILGISAGFMNYVLMTEKTRLHRFTRVKSVIKSGMVIEDGMIEAFEMPGNYDSLARTLVSHENFLKKGMIARREMHPGEMLMWQDLMRPEHRVKLPAGQMLTFVDLSTVPLVPEYLREGHSISFVVVGEDGTVERLGPYEIHTVGASPTQSDAVGKDRQGARDRRNDRMIGLSLKVDDSKHYEPESERLIQAIAARTIRMVDLDHESGHLDRDDGFRPGNVRSLGLGNSGDGGEASIEPRAVDHEKSTPTDHFAK